MTKKRIDEIRARCDAATPWPWDVGVKDDKFRITRVDTAEKRTAVKNRSLDGIDMSPQTYADIEFVIAARQDLPDLLDEVERLAAAYEALDKETWVYAEKLCNSCSAEDDIAIVYGEGLCAECRDKSGWKNKAEAERDKWQKRAERLECAVYGMCAVCLHNGEPINRDDSPCFEMGLTSGSGYFPQCTHFELDKAKFAGEEKK